MNQSRELRQAFGRFASGVTVVTTLHEGKITGMTANSFVSVSLDPPLVLISVDHHAHLHPVLAATRRYGVSVLAEHQQLLSTHFAGRGPETVDVHFFEHGGVPLIGGALAHFVIDVTEAHRAGDHTLYIGQVEYFEYFDGRPLVFYSGQYRQLENPSAAETTERDSQQVSTPVP